MGKITKAIILRDYKLLKIIAFAAYRLKLYTICFDAMSTAANLMYNFNLFYSDNEFEKLIKSISKVFPENKSKKCINRVVFYDYFSLDNRGLSEQYLQGLIDLKYEILYITLQNDSSKMHNIISKLENYSKANIFYVKSKKPINSCREIIQKINQFNPSKILFHSAPWDVVGCVSLSCFEGKCERFLINLTDHAFWLGKCSNDYFIEFRSYGANISVDYRDISNDKLMILPYYPITNSTTTFQGFPFDTQNKRLIFSGGSLYKIYGSSVFLEIIKYILSTYTDTIFLFLGNGDDKPIKKFITDNNFSDRFFYGKERKDINEIIKRCYFYLGTYPIAGGLMSQFAVQNNKIPVAYTHNALPINIIDEFFINNTNSFTFFKIDQVYEEIDKLLTDNEYYNKRIEETKSLIINAEEFKTGLRNCLENRSSNYAIKRYSINNESFCQIYLDQENNYLHNYARCFLFKKNIVLAVFFMKYTFQLIIDKFRKLIKKSYDF